MTGRLTVRQREELVRSLTVAGLSARLLAGQVGVTERTVCRIRRRLRETGGLPSR